MSKHKTIKEYVYLDNLEVNSILAQFDDGIPKVIQEIKQSTESNSEGTSTAMNGNVEAGVDAIAKGTAKFGGEYSLNNNDTNSEMYQEAISTVYHDYAVNIVTQELDSAKLLKTTTRQSEGAFVQLTSHFNIIDPVSIGSRIDNEMTSFILDLDNDNNDSELEAAKQGFLLISQLGTLLNKLFPESMLISTNNALTIAEKSNFRMNESQLKSLVLANRKITVLGKIESIVHDQDLNVDSIIETIATNPSSITTLMPKLSFNTLSALNLIKKEDRLIKPIAIYFE
ncbi:hypothetical protein [Limosilactobacillus coleohominis]|uniref:DUF6414 family protein n=1 Tax=Limosilactobacillus coleohominis TaxID=181675 RepID=UPI002A9096C3|nr:hypothetical protein [Limosilactobacillus coleohominis]MDY5628885.1 hypothetical protein [Limosilactobacillus coleohominis]